MSTIIDDARAKEIVARLDLSYKSKVGLLAETEDLVEHQVPEGVLPLSLEHALFLFYIIPNDHGTKSSRLWARAKSLFAEIPELFMPMEILAKYESAADHRLIETLSGKLGTRYPREAAKSWYLNSTELNALYDNDPRNIFVGTDDARVLMKRIRRFRGFGPKTGGMYLRAALGLGFARVTQGLDSVLVPVDIHDSRIAFLTSIVRLPNQHTPDTINYYDYVRTIQQVWLNACNDLGINWLDVDRALWIIGSRGCVSRRCWLCPINDHCSVGKSMFSFTTNEV